MKIIVQKFGGTSVSTPDRRNMVIERVMDAVEKGYMPVVVVSAMGRKGDPYATDTLLSLTGIRNIDDYKRETDLLMCCGEIISAVVMAGDLAARGCSARVLTGGNAGIITDKNYGDARVINVETKNILSLLSQGIIPIVTGFQGMTEDGDYTTLGRGGSDVTGALLGSALNAEFVEIYTDVDGVMTADPRIVPDARVIDEISYDDVFQLADQGAKVVHPRAVEYAMKCSIPMVIKNTFSNAPGTAITAVGKGLKSVITGVTSMSYRTQITVNNPEMLDQYRGNILELLAQKHISIDMINIFRERIVFTVDCKDSGRVESILRQEKADYQIINDCCKVAVLGNTMRGIPGIMAKILSTLNQNDIEVLQTSDSHTTIWCLVREKDKIKALNELHRIFFYSDAALFKKCI